MASLLTFGAISGTTSSATDLLCSDATQSLPWYHRPFPPTLDRIFPTDKNGDYSPWKYSPHEAIILCMKKEVLITLGGRIRELRKSLDMTQEELAAVAELDRSYVGGIERGERNITIEMLGKVCIALNCDIAALTYDLPEPRK